MSDNKIKVETTGNFMLQDPDSGDVIEAYGTSEVKNTSFVQSQIANGRLKTSETSKVEQREETADQAPLEGTQLDTGGFSSRTTDTKKVGSAKRNNPSSVVSA